MPHCARLFIVFQLESVFMYLLSTLNRLFAFPGRRSESCSNRKSISGWLARSFATLAVMASLCGCQESIEEYEFKYQKAAADVIQFKKELAREKQVTNSLEVSPEDRNRLAELQKIQGEILDKLIELKPEHPDYRFEQAKLADAVGDSAQAHRILNELAPQDAPGYPPAHLVLATNYFDKVANGNGNTGIEKTINLQIALQHVTHVLTHDENDDNAKLLNAKILTKLERYEPARDFYEDLLDSNPNYYKEVVTLNNRIGREDRNEAIYEKALASFQLLAKNEEHQADVQRWIAIELGIANTLQNLGRHEEAFTQLEEKLRLSLADPNGSARRVFLQRLLASTYIDLAGEVAGTTSYDSLPSETLERLVELYGKAFGNQGNNELAMQALARLSLNSNVEIATKARAVYDPNADVDAPASVLNQLGIHALIGKKFSEAIRYYERAREKSPRDPAVLNNLSYAYLVGEDERNPERALQLVSEAIRYLPKEISPLEKSKFFHTKATALKQMDRIQDALVLYEKGLKARPNHADTLRSLIECYRALNKNPPDEYVSRLEKIDNQK